MDNFPKDFNRVTCVEQISKNQQELIRTTRLNLYETILKAVEDCALQVNLSFPYNLKFEHRYTLTKELLSRFNFITVKTIPTGSNTIVKKTITDPINVPINVEGVTITLV